MLHAAYRVASPRFTVPGSRVIRPDVESRIRYLQTQHATRGTRNPGEHRRRTAGRRVALQCAQWSRALGLRSAGLTRPYLRAIRPGRACGGVPLRASPASWPARRRTPPDRGREPRAHGEDGQRRRPQAAREAAPPREPRRARRRQEERQRRPAWRRQPGAGQGAAARARLVPAAEPAPGDSHSHMALKGRLWTSGTSPYATRQASAKTTPGGWHAAKSVISSPPPAGSAR